MPQEIATYTEISQSFPKTKRLLKSLEFKKVLDSGEKVLCPKFVLYGTKTEHSQARIGLIVSKKVGNAVVRNHVKRRLREVFRLGPMAKNLDLVVIARHSSAKASTEQIAISWERSLARLRKKVLLNQSEATENTQK